MYISWPLAMGSTKCTSNPNTWETGAYYSVSGMANIMAATGNFKLDRIQLEVSYVASPHQRLDAGTTLQLCQRYFEKTNDLAIAPGNNCGWNGSFYTRSIYTGYEEPIANWKFNTPKRVAPTVTLYNPGNTAGGQWNYSSNSGNTSYARAVQFDEFGGRIDNTGQQPNAVGTWNIQAVADAEM